MTSRTAVAWAVSAAVGFGLTSFFGKLATSAIDATQVGLIRYAVGLLCVLALVIAGRMRRPVAWWLLLLRGFLGGLSGLLYYLSLNHLPVGTTAFLNCTSPVFAAGFAAVFLREVLTGQRLIAFGMSCVGVGAVVFGQGARLGGPLEWQGVALLSGMVAGGAVVTVRAARRTDGIWEIFAFFAVFGVAFTGPFALTHWRWPDDQATRAAFAWAVGGGVISLYAQLALTLSLGKVEAPVGAGISELNFVTALSFGALFMREEFSHVSLFGAAVTFIGVVWLAWATAQPSRHSPPRQLGTN
jgi:drug/metabolite transporter (DMT)-like permease